MKRTRKIKNRILAIPAETIAIPVKPNIAATIATIKNIKDHFSIRYFLQTMAKKVCH
jgi:hypothetical protein